LRIQRIEVDGYRRFKSQSMQLEAHTTVLAGSNNSGKTSFIDLLGTVIGDAKDLTLDDFNAVERLEWAKLFIEFSILGREACLKFLTEGHPTHRMPAVEVKLEIGYDPLSDDIREFADFLMDLDGSRNSIYFLYRCGPKIDRLLRVLDELADQINAVATKDGWTTPLTETQTRTQSFHSLQTLIDAALLATCETTFSFCDETYSTAVSMEKGRFRSLFNFRLIKASRPLDDMSDDNSGGLGKRLVEVAKESTEWSGIVEGLPDQVLEAINATNIRDITAKGALESLNDVVKSIARTNGSSQNDLFLDFLVSEGDVVRLIARAMQTRYSSGGVPLGESSQGLGYSNLIYLHLEVESFVRAASLPENTFLVNVMVIEEPESHMHPQMQNAFIKHLLDRVKAVGKFQTAITTHSSEIVRASGIEILRALKVRDNGCQIIDLREFHERNIKGKSETQRRLFSFLYSINFADVLFADKVVMYEGDTERMYVQALIESREDLKQLQTQFVSYVQVGGAFAHIYKPLIVDTLKIKTVIITDLDYDKDSRASSPAEMALLSSTNSTLNLLFPLSSGANPTVGDLYEAKGLPELAHVTGQPLLAIAFQSGSEGYARTLEEAIMSAIFGGNVWDSKSKNEWTKLRLNSELSFAIPSKVESPTIRQIVVSTSGSKTDFMYSLLLRKTFHDEVPPYILSALKWLVA
jgi:putative ATP-dependent endonuclease of OLD family